MESSSSMLIFVFQPSRPFLPLVSRFYLPPLFASLIFKNRDIFYETAPIEIVRSNYQHHSVAPLSNPSRHPLDQWCERKNHYPSPRFKRGRRKPSPTNGRFTIKLLCFLSSPPLRIFFDSGEFFFLFPFHSRENLIPSIERISKVGFFIFISSKAKESTDR